MKRDTNHSEHSCCGRNILRLPHADEFAQFHNKLRFQLFGVVSMATVSERGRTRVEAGRPTLRNTRMTRLEVLKW